MAVRLPLLKSATFLLFLLTRTTGKGFFRRVEVLFGIVRVPAIPGRNRSRKNLRKSDPVASVEIAVSVDPIESAADRH